MKPIKFNNTTPISKKDVLNDLKKIGITEGVNIMVHSSLSKIGWVIGGAYTVVEALVELIGEKGTLVMPAATPYCLHPTQWGDDNIPKKWSTKIAKNLPLFNIKNTPTTMGAIPETFRNWNGSLRSNHPISSVSARGAMAKDIVEEHNLVLSESINTPYEKIYNNDFKILLLGVGFNRCTMLHFGESLSNNPRLTKSKYQIIEDNRKKWVEIADMANDNSTYFPQIGKEFLELKRVRVGKIGSAESMLFSTKELVDFSIQYFNQKI
ncbi:hypothetical protein ATO12_08130 [Aquimarina atlantica]|uniref:Aminoglycoside N(3)-acetyltransferase n=1 Tax=Aquimarina atlantica TaxID=1317122 RepID=A0A023BMR3_9FLAO|nr:AAC(3) family N-acetyltransferase [Aquimarina atlantica]EZH71347.1 hypothetical protein ATO12_08130 [Aquimarina atlantica]